MKIRNFVWLAAFLAFTSGARAEIFIDTYEKERGNDLVFLFVKQYLDGVQEGLSWANIVNQRRNAPRVFCQPERLVISADDTIKMVDAEIQLDWVRELRKKERIPMSFIVLQALQRSFPCN